MQKTRLILILVFLAVSMASKAQVVFASGNASGSTQLIPWVGLNICVFNSTVTTNACGVPVSFQYTSPQVGSCPITGMIAAAGSVTWGGAGSSATFLNYHTVSGSSANENQRFTFGSKITKFQWSASGPGGPAEPFQIQVRDGGTLVGTFSFTVPGAGLRLTYNVSGPQFDRIDFVETNAISADDELLGDFRIATAGCPLAMEQFTTGLQTMDDHSIRVHWEATDEVDMDRHVLYHSTDAQSWVPIAEMAAQNTSGRSEYHHRHQDAPKGMNYYYIEALSLDGSSFSSHLLQAQIGDDIRFHVFPSPAEDRITVDFAGLQGEKQVTIANMLGQVVFSTPSSGDHLDLDVSQFQSGMYFVKVRAGSGSNTARVEVMH